MKILLTGGGGMVGRNLLEHPRSSAHQWLTPSRKELDLLNAAETAKYVLKQAPDLIVHAAGRVGGIQANIRFPVEFLVENIEINKSLLMAAKNAGVRKVLNLGSSCIYPRAAVNPLREEMILQGELEPTNEGYALAKIMALRLCEYIGRENSALEYKTLIPCNLYGRHDKFDPAHSHLVPAIIHKVSVAKKTGHPEIEIWGDGEARREFMLASDLADCILECI